MTISAALAVLLAFQSPATPKAEAEAKPDDGEQKVLVPDMRYTPKVGDVVCLYRRGASGKLEKVEVGTSPQNVFAMKQAIEAKDQVGVDRLRATKEADWLPSGTQVRILSPEVFGPGTRIPGTNVRTGGLPSYFRVRFIDGPLKDAEYLVLIQDVKRCRLAPLPKGKASAKKATAR